MNKRFYAILFYSILLHVVRLLPACGTWSMGRTRDSILFYSITV